MSRFLPLSMLLLVISTADPAAAGDWSGPYAGLQFGYGAGQTRSSEVNGPREYFTDSHGAVTGLVGGYLLQRDRYVYGVEAEAGYLGLKGSQKKGVSGGTVGVDTQLGAFATFAARGGYLLQPDLLVSGKAGLAVTGLDAATTQTCALPGLCGGAQSSAVSRARTDDVTLGVVAGVGLEKQLSQNWSIRTDYQYLRFRPELALPKGDGPGWNMANDAHTLKIGVTRRF